MNNAGLNLIIIKRIEDTSENDDALDFRNDNDIHYPNVRNFTTELNVAELIDPVRELMPALK
jgi:hypothetical protein